jgi:hypothetical protein
VELDDVLPAVETAAPGDAAAVARGKQHVESDRDRTYARSLDEALSLPTRSPGSPSPGPARAGLHLAVREQQVGTIRSPRHGRRLQHSACPGAGPETSARRIRRHSSEENYVQVGRHARHGRLTFSRLRGKYRHKRRRNRPPEAKERSQQDHGRAQQYQHHAVAVPAPRQFEVAGPTSGCRASPPQYVPSHVFGAMKSRGVLTPADSIR